MENIDKTMQEFLKDARIVRDFYHPNEYELRPYLVRDSEKHPAAIICPGGAYGMVCSYVEGEPLALQLNKMGISAFVLYYHVRELAQYPTPQEDVARAVREIHNRADEWDLDIRNYSIWGASAGGHLVASFGTEKMGYLKYGLPKPGALVLTYPVVTMGELTHADTRSNHLGKNYSPEDIAMASVEKQITEAYPPTFIWCGDADNAVPPENSRMLADALQKMGIAHQLVVYPGVGHGVGLGTDLACEGWIDKAVDFWRAQR